MKKTPTGKMLKRGRKREKRKSHQHGTESSCIKKTCEAWWSRQYIKIFFSFPSHFHLAREKRWKCRKKNYNLAERHWRGARMWFYGTVRE